MALANLLASFAPACIPPEAEALRAEVKAFLGRTLAGRPAAERARTWTAFDPEFSRALAARGWVGLSIPREYGGAGLGPFHRFVLVEELLAAGAPVAAHWIADRQSAPLLLRFGTEEQKRRFLPAIAKAQLFFCIGMSEPGAGSDLAAVATRAERRPDGWRLDGRKIWTTWAHRCHWMIALVRTSGGSEDRQRGLSQFLIDLSAPGVTIRPIRLVTGDEEFSEVTFDDVHLPPEALVGREGEGWAQVTAELAFERAGPERLYSSAILLDLLAAALTRRPDPAGEELLGRLLADLATLRAMAVAVTARLAAGEAPVTAAAVLKDLGTRLEQEIPRAVAARLDPEDTDPELVQTLAFLLQLSPAFTIRGGTSEILRGMAARALGLRG
ncbi:MAG: acyl-CoA dehydrogenase family protein [Sphingomonadaceae bacterium]|uniref:acyl-CoA dehydrogenase family protein n=1 Tax=Thermaurantiacus sp. TaxID=2820283 RepID=UPI00298EDB1C|nr:acyl-CoA dehydrogenase family protein [Thermaurantiacus sp.]MCS6987032.1 acyl-CoA dehydrogenase family protein [Sphingomonadaceae bacterium]MDW8415630.1 acyl-CoA dehydrogenase family protein [Thermaurantiacus sp.]